MGKKIISISLLAGCPLICVVAAIRGDTSGRASSPSLVSPADQALAGQILDAAGVKGGLVVHLGCGNGKLTAALRASDSYLVHGLDADAGNVAVARRNIQSLGLYGKVSIDQCAGNRLPYIDNLVNLIVAEKPFAASMDEIMRVLAPNGVAYVKNGTQWTKTVKPRPKDIDEWTHYLHGPGNNAVAHDRKRSGAVLGDVKVPPGVIRIRNPDCQVYSRRNIDRAC